MLHSTGKDPVYRVHIRQHLWCVQLDAVHELLAHRRIPGEVRRITRPPRIQPPAKSISSISDMSDDLSIEEVSDDVIWFLSDDDTTILDPGKDDNTAARTTFVKEPIRECRHG